MRSRLEARFAAFLDNDSSIDEWWYEPRAFAGRAGQYLPDFRIDVETDANPEGYYTVFVEVRPTIEKAMGAFTQMPVIRESLHEATLVVWVPNVGLWINSVPDNMWRWSAGGFIE